MRVLLLTQWFEPEPAIKGLQLARALQEAGHEVHVVTGFPNYPGGKLYPGYRLRWRQTETIGGVRVTRVLLYPSHDGSAVRRIANYVSFAFSAALAGIFTRFKADVIYGYHPPLTIGVAALLIGFFRRVPFVYDIQDLWPDSLAATGMISSKRALGLIGWVAGRVYRRAALLIAQSQGFVERLAERGVPASKTRLIYNWCDEASLARRARPGAVDLSRLEDRFNVVFAGNMGKAQGLDAVIRAAPLVRAHAPKVQFVFVGSGTELETLRDAAAGYPNVLFLLRMGMAEVGSVLEAADALLVHLRDTPLFEITIPSKIQAYLYVGRPILVAVRGEAANLVIRARAGIPATPEDPASLAEAVLQLFRMPDRERAEMARSARNFYDEHLSLARGVRSTIEVLEQAVLQSGAAAQVVP